MRSSTIAIFLVALFIAITLAYADETQQAEATVMYKRQYGGYSSSSSTIELSFLSFAVMAFATLFGF
ncbi:hypothetical protein RclHR1_01270019 [Rhizophagus clarus]|uniref:Uncharacterized protein n=1 Tax=Rhizophagus clarus TaxID=94130 RepID=A0A2Z6Q818_9GLOM|nr:hypothetical protein RclHR1_01270019 [Rhizophagus clarus]GET02403.1 hypothetical protein GLOIN_2v1590430 [Rhizophagus clarus]